MYKQPEGWPGKTTVAADRCIVGYVKETFKSNSQGHQQHVEKSNLINKNFISHRDNDPKHSANTTKHFIGGEGGRFWSCQVNHQSLTQLSMQFNFLKRGFRRETHKTNNNWKKTGKASQKNNNKMNDVLVDAWSKQAIRN